MLKQNKVSWLSVCLADCNETVSLNLVRQPTAQFHQQDGTTGNVYLLIKWCVVRDLETLINTGILFWKKALDVLLG